MGLFSCATEAIQSEVSDVVLRGHELREFLSQPCLNPWPSRDNFGVAMACNRERDRVD
jgi:hypothetical protein